MQVCTQFRCPNSSFSCLLFNLFTVLPPLLPPPSPHILTTNLYLLQLKCKLISRIEYVELADRVFMYRLAH